MKLYHYVHCPFCLRVRMVLGHLNINYISLVLKYDDEITPTNLIGKKMLPIFEFDDGTIMPESLDIIAKLDANNSLQLNLYQEKKIEIDQLLNDLSSPIHSLCMPYWIWTFEFDQKSREYFQKKKEVKRGPFSELLKRKETFLTELAPILKSIENDLNPYYKNSKLTILDIIIASQIWGMFIFPEFQFSPKMYDYLMRVKKDCRFEYHQDLFN